jgi:biotin carboxyl carrier protein
MKSKFEFMHKEYEVDFERIGTSIWVHFQGETFLIEPKKTKRQTSQADESISTAPMPGKITKLMKSVGDEVSLGQIVVVMEAMKMEYSLKSNKAGVVKDLFCKLGDQVHLGQKLFEVQKKGE